jgi:hypothetical protein
MGARLRRLPHQERSVVHEPTDNIPISMILTPLGPTHLLPQHRGIDFEFEFILGRDAGALDFSQIDGVGEVLVAEAVFAALRRGGFVVGWRLDEVGDVHVGGEIDFEVHGDAAVVGLFRVLDVHVGEGHFDDVREDLAGSAVSGSAEAEFSALRPSSHGLWEGVEALLGEGGEGVGLEEMFVVDGYAAWMARGLCGGVEELVHGFVAGLENLLAMCLPYQHLNVAAYLFHSTLEAVLLVVVLIDDSSVDILAWGPVVLA